MVELIQKLYDTGNLSDEELKTLIADENEDTAAYLASRADEIRRKYYGNKVFLRGLIEISSYCTCSRQGCPGVRVPKGDLYSSFLLSNKMRIGSSCEN